MPFNGSKVVQIARERKLKGVDFKRSVYPNRTGNFTWDEIEKSTNPNAATIEAIADFLGCSIDELFDRAVVSNHVTGDNNTVGSNITISTDPQVLTATISHLNDTIGRQDKTIERQEKTIEELSSRIGELIELVKRNN